jgi:hypothetical protein
MTSYIIVWSSVWYQPSRVLKHVFHFDSFAGVLETPGVNPISLSSSVHLHRKILRNCKCMNINGTSYLIINRPANSPNIAGNLPVYICTCDLPVVKNFSRYWQLAIWSWFFVWILSRNIYARLRRRQVKLSKGKI